jgi:addiction module HigA family antidote
MRGRKRAPIHPGRILNSHYLKPLSLTITDLAKTLGASRKTLSKIVNERGSVTSDMALRLSRTFDTTPELWLNLQRNYDLWHAVHDSKDWGRVKPLKIPADSQIHT